MPDHDGDGTGELICVVTTILDHTAATAQALADAYHQRWEPRRRQVALRLGYG